MEMEMAQMADKLESKPKIVDLITVDGFYGVRYTLHACTIRRAPHYSSIES